jgi:hypothetical protein
MENTKQDQLFLDHGVSFLPWIGHQYEGGLNGRRFLVLGESHYGTWGGKKHILGHECTRECMEEVLARADGVAPFWRTVEQALLDEDRINGFAPGGGKPLWDKLVLYNFVQSPVSGGARARPTPKQFADSRKPFRAVLEQLRPERVWVAGKRLWEGMEPIPNEHESSIHYNVRAYDLDDATKAWCLVTSHPSRGLAGVYGIP